MNQRVVFFVALVCIAQLGVTLARNFWSKQSRQVQHVSLSRGSSPKNILKGPSSVHTSDYSAASGDDLIAKKTKSDSPKNSPEKIKQDPDRTAGSLKTTDAAPAPPREQAHETEGVITKALLPSHTPTLGASIGRTTQPLTAPARDPFVPFFQIRKSTGGDDNRPLTEYELSELKVTAIISDSHGERMASVETPSGRDFIVRPGGLIGPRGGRIVAILPAKLVIEEPSLPSGATITTTERELALKSPTPLQAIVATN